jgi:putative Ca2+/H+ antiporter (TMEM165/GDT1 family)
MVVAWVLLAPAAYSAPGLSALVGYFPGAQLKLILLLAFLPFTATALGLLSGLATLILSARRRQWGWFAGVIVCLVLNTYGGYFVNTSYIGEQFMRSIIPIFTATDYLRLALFINLTLLSTPMVFLTAIFAWTRRQPSPASAAA